MQSVWITGNRHEPRGMPPLPPLAAQMLVDLQPPVVEDHMAADPCQAAMRPPTSNESAGNGASGSAKTSAAGRKKRPQHIIDQLTWLQQQLQRKLADEAARKNRRKLRLEVLKTLYLWQSALSDEMLSAACCQRNAAGAISETVMEAKALIQQSRLENQTQVLVGAVGGGGGGAASWDSGGHGSRPLDALLFLKSVMETRDTPLDRGAFLQWWGDQAKAAAQLLADPLSSDVSVTQACLTMCSTANGLLLWKPWLHEPEIILLEAGQASQPHPDSHWDKAVAGAALTPEQEDALSCLWSWINSSSAGLQQRWQQLLSKVVEVSPDHQITMFPFNHQIRADVLSALERLLLTYRINMAAVQATVCTSVLGPRQVLSILSGSWPLVPPVPAVLAAVDRRRRGRLQQHGANDGASASCQSCHQSPGH